MTKRALKLGFLVPLAIVSAAAAADCVVYEHRDFGGASLTIVDQETVKMVRSEGIGCTTNGHGGNCPSETFRPEWNDRISSYKVGRGCTHYMWQDVNERGWKLTRPQPTMSYIGDRRNDQVSEAKCVC